MINKKHSSFFRGVLAGIALVAFVDILFFHLLLGSHRIYYRSSVDIVEPLIVIIALIVFLIIVKKELKREI